MATVARGDPAVLARAHARLLRDARFQFDFPTWRPPAPTRASAWLRAVVDALGAVLPYVFWAAVIGGCGFLAWMLISALRVERERRGRPVALAGTGFALAPGRAKALLETADRLAREGRFGEAVRVLLLRTLDDLDARRPGLAPPSLTSREITRLKALPAEARARLARIAAEVEQVAFAGRETDADAFQACRSAYVGFAEAVA